MYLSLGLMGYRFNTGGVIGAVQEKTLLSSETSLGYVFKSWLYVGGLFNYTVGTDKTTDGTGSATNHQLTYQYYGPSLGFMGSNFFLLGHYFLNAQHKDVVTPDTGVGYTDDRTGSGFGASIGYKVVQSTLLEVAPVLAYKAITYENCRNRVTGATAQCNPKISQNEFTPYITLLINFR